MKQARIQHTLVSTPFELYVLGGYYDLNNINSCEKLNNAEIWEKSPDLNTIGRNITASYIYHNLIYIFGSG